MITNFMLTSGIYPEAVFGLLLVSSIVVVSTVWFACRKMAAG